MTPPFWPPCWPIRGHIKHAATGHRHHHARRVGHAVKRVAGLAISKPAIIGWTCLAIGGGWMAAGMPGWPPYTEMGPTLEGIAGDFWPPDYFPPEFGLEAPEIALATPEIALEAPGIALATPEIDISALMLPEITSGGSEQTSIGETTGQAVPEPASLVLLVTAVAALVIIRGRRA